MAGPLKTRWRPEIGTDAIRGQTGGQAIYAMGDIHGCYDLAVVVLSAIVDDIAALPAGSQPLIVFLGDYVDRGTRSADVLSMLVWMRQHAPCDVLCLMGNHESMMLKFIAAPEQAIGWLNHGGVETLRSYGVAVDHDLAIDRQGQGLRDLLLDRMPASHLNLLQTMPLRATCGNYAFVHAGVRPGVPFSQQSDEDCLWIRDDFLTARNPFDAVIVHGHTWRSEDPIVTATRIGIDTGAYETGVLTAVKLLASDVRFLQAGPADRVWPTTAPAIA